MGGTWAYLHDVQDALIAKIKATGQSGFTVAEQASIDSFATHVAQSKLEEQEEQTGEITTNYIF